MKIVHLITRGVSGGAQTYVLELIKGFSNRFEIVLATGEEGFLTEAASSLGIKVYILPSLIRSVNPLQDIQASREILNLINTEKPDLLHAHSSKAGLLGRISATIAGVPAIYTDHGWAFAAELPWYWKALAIPSEQIAARYCSKIITISEYDLSLALKYRVASSSKITLVYYGLPDTELRANPGNTECVKLVMVARFAPQKDQFTLIKALAGIEEEFELQLVGDGETRGQVESLVSELGLQSKVKFLGKRSDVEYILQDAQISVLSTNWESFGLVSVEGMRAGLPVIATDIGGVNEVVVDGETGFLIPKGDAMVLRQRLTQLITDTNLRIKMGEAGRKRYETNFTLQRMLDQTLGVYYSVLRLPTVALI
ncbi:MAG: glycosyltransferase family 4 protein [Rivularia sp. (in: cyanobacteria)]